MAHLSKSDFKVAQTCATKLYYKKMNYPTSNEGNEYLELLAEGGYMVGKLATLLYDGEDLSSIGDKIIAIQKTKELLDSKNNVTIFEAAIESNHKLIRIDILQKEGNVLKLIEVKAKSWDNDRDRNKQAKELHEYLEDLAYQTLVLQEAFPQYKVVPYLFLPDKSKTTQIEGLNSLFKIQLKEVSGNFKSFQVDFKGDIAELRKDDIMTLIDFSDEIEKIIPAITPNINIYLKSINPKIKKIETQISVGCKDCEYRISDSTKNGFKECWKKLADEEPHVLELTQLGNMNRIKESPDLINNFIKNGKANLKELDATLFIGKRNNKPYLQITSEAEVINEELKHEINSWEYPLAFIDFETSRMALPYHNGMRPYENVAFQFSCHIIEHPEAEPKHKEWLNVNETFPNFKFAEELMACLTGAKTILIWSHHENTILRDIYEQMTKYNYTNEKLKLWLEEIVNWGDDKLGGLTDMAALCNKHYYHPITKGKYSIKYVLPAVLAENKSEKILKWLQNFEGINLLQKNDKGLIWPYSALPEINIASQAEKVKDGTGAMRAYQEMMCGMNKDNASIKEEWAKALKVYCKLDTLAMVVIWQYWKEYFENNNA